MLAVVAVVAAIGGVSLVVTHAATGTRIAIASDSSGKGYWVSASDGGVFSQGDAVFHGSKGDQIPPSDPVVGMAVTSDGGGYWLVDQTGQVYAFGDAPFNGSLPNNYPSAHVDNIVGIAANPTNNGYWLVGSDGGVFSFGTPFHGSAYNFHPTSPIVGIASTPDGGGYWLVGSDGGVFAFGDAPFKGSAAGTPLTAPVSGIARQGNTDNYWLVARDGGVFAYGASFYGSLSGVKLNGPIMGMTSTPDGGGYWLVGADGGVFAYGDAPFLGTPPKVNPVTTNVGALPKPVCSSLDVSQSGRTVTIGGVGINANGNTYNSTVINWGDGSAQPSVPNVSGQSHTYNYGTFTVTATPHFTVDGQDYAASSANCQRVVSFAAPAPAPASGGSQGAVSHSSSSAGSSSALNTQPISSYQAHMDQLQVNDKIAQIVGNPSSQQTQTQQQAQYQAQAGQLQTVDKEQQINKLLGFTNTSNQPVYIPSTSSTVQGSWGSSVCSSLMPCTQ